MSKETNAAVLADVPRQIFESMLGKLQEQKMPDEVIGRLRKTLLVDVTLTEAALSESLFGIDAPS